MLENKKISLDGEWTLYYAPNKAVKASLPAAPLTEAVLRSLCYDNVPAVVPGNFELDLQRAGIIDEPFYACNTIELQKYENLHLFYVRRFTLSEANEHTYLCFEGIDTVADIFINGKLLGSTDNMLIPFEFRGQGLQVGENELVIHITPAHIAARDYPLPVSCHTAQYNYDSLAIRKAPHMYGWDIMPRALSGGLWRPCYVEQRLPDRIDDLFVWTHAIDVENRRGAFGFFWNMTLGEDSLKDYHLHIEGSCKDSRFEVGCPVLHTGGKITASVPNAYFWYPRNYGDPDLYEITATLYRGEEALHTYHTAVGLRTVTLKRTGITDKEGNGEFVFLVNGQKVFWQGTNWVPVDAYHSRDRERLTWILPMLCDLNCNCLRCWGGNVYEDDYFYDFCDRHGIMVWQDFAHACAINPQDDDYCRRFGIEVEKTVKRLRNHTSIMLWAGDNEVDMCYDWASSYVKRDPNRNRLTREVLPRMLDLHDFSRPYLPSSPYIDEEAFEATSHGAGEVTSEYHLWGPRDYFKGDYYGNSICHFASETGYHGCPAPASLKRYIRPEQLWHWRKYEELYRGRTDVPKDDWACHASCAATDGEDGYFYRIGLMSRQVKVLFTDFRTDEEGQGLEKFAKASQISQAEAKKYFIERFRVTKWRRTGIIWWNLIDGWPQISDAIVDYYGMKKLAYHYIKNSQQQLCLIFDEPRDGVLPLHIATDLQSDVNLRCRVTDFNTDREIFKGEFDAPANSVVKIFEKPMEEGEKHFYFIEWEYDLNGETVKGKNHYVTNIKDLELDTYFSWMKKTGWSDLFEGFEN